MKFGLRCRHCGETNVTDSVELLVAWYLIHTVQNHWEYVEALRNADDQMIRDVYAYGKRHRLFPS